jgi:hypothetical protein
MKLICSLWLCACLARGATLTISPSAIYDCQNGYASAVLTWSGASGPVQIHLLKPDGPALTGFNDPSGSTTTGNWVGDGLQFFLVNQSGITEATATAHVSCGGTAGTLNQGLQGGSYFPLQIGNTWVYRYSDRLITNSYVIRTISGTETINGQTWYVMMQGGNVVGKYRGDNSGVIWVATTTGQQVFLDPTAAGVQHGSYSGPLGSFSDALSINGFANALEMDSTMYVRGVGLASLSADLVTGSSGGFSNSLDLVEARLNGVRLALPESSIHLAIESADLDLTDKTAPNCPLPCYFVACGLGGPQPDPPGTYRPCAQTRLETSAAAGDTVQLQLLDPSGTVVFKTTAPTDAGGNAFDYFRLPLYTSQSTSSAFTLLPPGNYKLVGRLLASGVETASSAIDVRVR